MMLRKNPISRRNVVLSVLVFAAVGTVALVASKAANPNLPGDLNNDNAVNVTDLSILLSNYRTTNAVADVNSDGIVNVLDLSILLSHYGQTISATTYYLDCNSGNDSTNNGLSPDKPWKTLAKANGATLQPGQSLLLKRGCTWNEELTASWNGTAAKLITIGAYGTGSDPLVQRDAKSASTNVVNVNITGTYQVVQNIRSAIINPALNTDCTQPNGSGQPTGWYVAFYLKGDHNTLQYVDGSFASAGVVTLDSTSNSRVMNSHFHDLHYLWQLQKASGGALGSIGINLHGDDGEYAYNKFDNNNAHCMYQDGTTSDYSAPFEVYNANRNYVHHNQAFNHRKHFEMGHDSNHVTDDNVLAYNLFVSDYRNSVGPNIHGSGNPFGPINRTQIYNNAFVMTGVNSSAIVCSCDGAATLKNNIFIGEWKAAYYSGNITESNNIYWDYQKTTDSTADPFVQIVSANVTAISPTSKKINPLFVNSDSDWRLQLGSPGINAGTSISTTDTLLKAILSKDLNGKAVPAGSAPDIGPYEF
jgi:hypothetical protein